jgi:hypothetical protein
MQRSLEESSGGRKPFSAADNVKDTLYMRYKKCTQRFKDALQSMVPRAIFGTDTAQALMDAADHVANSDIAVDWRVMSHLKVAIRTRQRVATHKYGDGDMKHAYFVNVLLYCWHVLLPKRQKPTVTTKPQMGNSEQPNRFADLAMEEPSDEDDDMEDDFPTLAPGAVQRPEETGPTRLSLQELMAGSDRMDTIVFLTTLDELMQSVAQQYAKLKETSSWVQGDKYTPTIMIEQVMEASVATNLAIQQVNTVYRVLANLVLVVEIVELTKVASKKSPIASEFTEKHAVEFLGDTLECAFRNASYPQNRQGSLVQEFLDRWRISKERATPREPAGEMTEEALRRMVDSISLPEDVVMESSVPG